MINCYIENNTFVVFYDTCKSEIFNKNSSSLQNKVTNNAKRIKRWQRLDTIFKIVCLFVYSLWRSFSNFSSRDNLIYFGNKLNLILKRTIVSFNYCTLKSFTEN